MSEDPSLKRRQFREEDEFLPRRVPNAAQFPDTPEDETGEQEPAQSRAND